MKCETPGCLAPVMYYATWGCLEGHVYHGTYCLSCALAKRTRLNGAQSQGRLICESNHFIEEMFLTPLDAPKSMYALDGSEIR